MVETIKQKAEELTLGASSKREASWRIIEFVRNQIKYNLDEWDVPALSVLDKGAGMCAGKALLASELHRAAGIATRFKAIKIHGEGGLLDFIAGRLEEAESPDISNQIRDRVIESIRSLPPHRDHILLQVLLDNEWVDFDLARDEEFEYGVAVLGMDPREKTLSEEGIFDSLEEWLKERMKRRSVLEEREIFFAVINRQMEKIRLAGALALKAGVKPWRATGIDESFKKWKIPTELPLGFDAPSVCPLDQLAEISRSYLISLLEKGKKVSAEGKLVDWLCRVIRNNIKRGKYWNLSDVLSWDSADCLGYAKLFSFLGRAFGLDTGVIEVLQDNRGAYVPHFVSLVNLSDGKKKLVDLWCGSTAIKHRLMTARIEEKEKLVLKNLTMAALESATQVCGLAPEHLSGVDFYVLGNSFLEREMITEAVNCYDISIWLYPINTRALFNQAIAFERMGKTEKAKENYRRLFSMTQSFLRVLSNIEEMKSLICLDERKIEDRDQKIYLLRKGFITGKREPWKEIANKLNRSPGEIQKRFKLTLVRLEK